MKEELERRTRELFPLDPSATHLDYAEHWVADGGTLVSLAKSVSGSTGTHVMRETLRRYINAFDGAEARLGAARIHASHAMVEDAQDLADADHAKEDVPRAKLRIDTKLKVAQLYNRTEFGESKGGNSITINVNTLHLNALRNREVQALKESAEGGSPTRARSIAAGETSELELLPAIDRAIAEEAEVVSIEAAHT